jgi:hypothetical protein
VEQQRPDGSRVARGERHSDEVEVALNKEFEQIEGREA